MRFIFPPRPKGRMTPSDLPMYEKSGGWVAQRKYRGSRAVIYISKNRDVFLGSRHGKPFSNFELSRKRSDELISSLNLDKDKDYWLDGELMNKDVNSTKEIILFDVLQVGRYLFYKPSQLERLDLLSHICNYPKKVCPSEIALEVSDSFWLAPYFLTGFKDAYNETITNVQLEGLVLRKRNKGLENSGDKEYETPNLLRCRKPFSKEKGYEF